jgi:predicted GTPase
MVESSKQKISLAGARKPVSMVFLGCTGAGKTTLLTALEDFVKNKSFEERTQTKRVTDKKGVSQTKDVKQFSYCGGDYQINIIDTPGLADTEGIFEDEKHLKNISQYLIDVGEFNAVCIVMKAGANERA